MQYIIPTIFTAVNQLSRPTVVMGNDLARMSQKADMVKGSMAGTNDQMVGFIKNAVGVTAALGAMAVSGKALTGYEDSVASFRTIVSDLNNTEFTKFKDEIATVAFDAKRTTIDVAQSFEKIAGLNAKFAETAEGLGMVSSASIVLAKASRMQLGPAAENLVGIMNQFSFGVTEANRTINVLAAGQAVGAASITQTAEALNNFGATAAGANVTLEQSVALIQTMAKLGQTGGEAGNQLRSALIKIQEAGVGYSGGKFDIAKGLDEVKAKFDALQTPMAQDAYLTSVFGLQQITAGRILVSNIDTFKEFTRQVTGTNEAQRAASINTGTFTEKLDNLKTKWVNIITTSDRVSGGMNALSRMTVFLTDHMEGLLTIAVPIVGTFVAWKSATWLMNTAMFELTGVMRAYNFITGIAAVKTGTLNDALLANPDAERGATLAMGGYNKVIARTVFLLTLAYSSLKSLNEEMSKEKILKGANPLGLDFNKDADSWGNSKILDKYNIPEKQFNDWRVAYNNKWLQLNSGGGPIGNFVLDALKYSPMAPNIELPNENVDSVRTSIDSMMQHLNDIPRGDNNLNAPEEAEDSTSTYNKNTTNKQVVEVHVKAAPGTRATVGNNAGAIPVTVSQTGSYTNFGR